MWIKLLGICLVCVSCAGIGGGEALCLIGRRRFLEEVKRIAAGLRGEIGYTQAVLPLVLCRAGARGDGKAGKLFLVAGERLGESRVSVWAYLGSGSGRAGDSYDARNRGMGADVPVWKQHRVSRSGNAAKDAGTVSGRIGTGD